MTLSTVRCSAPDCDWGFEIQDITELDLCYLAFQCHCIDLHLLHSNDSESYLYLDLENLLLSVWKA
jgi:hypothetical protein